MWMKTPETLNGTAQAQRRTLPDLLLDSALLPVAPVAEKEIRAGDSTPVTCIALFCAVLL